mmetsp:Transcript_64485/g.127496  ORF Transcript_64485/g.127496 Transcript_64485/m.127496 type:complete len:172 (-) Transcript_64485:66-581(-)
MMFLVLLMAVSMVSLNSALNDEKLPTCDGGEKDCMATGLENNVNVQTLLTMVSTRQTGDKRALMYEDNSTALKEGPCLCNYVLYADAESSSPCGGSKAHTIAGASVTDPVVAGKTITAVWLSDPKCSILLYNGKGLPHLKHDERQLAAYCAQLDADWTKDVSVAETTDICP